jgi:ligand-binding sensor domain-containing protein
MSLRRIIPILATGFLLFSVGCTAATPPQATATSTRLPTETPTETPVPPTPTITLTPSPTPILRPGWIHFTSDLNSVMDMAFDQDGFLWVATRNQGLLKWDVAARSYTQITKNDGLPGNNTTAVAVAPDGSVWAGFGNYVNMPSQSAGMAIAKLDGGSWTPYVFPDTWEGEGVDDMTFAPDGTLWIVHRDTVRSFDGKVWTAYDEQLQPLPETGEWPNGQRIAIAPDGDVWAVGFQKGLLRFHDGTWSSVTADEGLETSRIADLAILPNGTVWVTFEDAKLAQAASFDGSAWSYVTADTLGDCRPGLFAVTPDGKFWSSYYYGIIRTDWNRCEVFDGAKWKAADFEKGTIPFRSASSVLVGPDGAVWFGVDTQGLFRFDGKTVESYQANAPTGVFYSSLKAAPDGSIWVKSQESGVLRFDGARWTTLFARPGLPFDQVGGIQPAKDGSVWLVGPEGTALHYREGGWSTVRLPTGNYDDYLSDTALAPNGGLWFAGTYAFLAPSGNTWVRKVVNDLRYYDSSRTDRHVIKAMAAAPDGTIWFGTGVGVSRYRNGVYSLFLLPSEMVVCLTVTPNGEVWFATHTTYAGPPGPTDPHRYVARFNENAEGYAEEKALGNQSVWALRTGPDGVVYALADDGIYRYSGGSWNLWGFGPVHVDDMAFAPDGSIWFIKQGEISRYQQE